MYTNFTGFMEECVLDTSKTINNFKSNPDMWFAIEHEGQTYTYTDGEMNKLWECILIERERIRRILSLTPVPINSEMDFDIEL